ncbi:M1 family metallopeptidase [Flavobacterium sp. N2270]|uniref:M1 family metallopeptidase n=1 Tax=Flavobacterium sp. N2270 TaxID=2986831 RepID=UPI002224DEFD|nr:M1 family metallopeptidase [Flavobacterium sp. N2270]
MMFRFLFICFFTISTFAQQFKKVDFISCNASITPISSDKVVLGSVTYEFNVFSTIDTISIDAINMEFINVELNGKKVDFINTRNKLQFYEGFQIGKNKLSFNYSAKPKQTLYFIGEGDDLQIWTQGQGKYTSHWLPSFDDVNEKVIFKIKVDFEPKFEVITNGKYEFGISQDGMMTSSYQMQKPMSSYLVMLAIGKFVKQTDVTKSGTKLEYYLDRNDADKFEPTYRYSKQMFNFLEKEIGVKYPWGIYRQVPVRDFLYAGMENTTSTIFAQDFVVDEIGFNDKNYVNVNAHELAHQWFGDFITAKESKHHWLQEGFATYYALLAEKEIFGDDYFNYELFQMADQLKQAAKTDTIPILNEKASSLTFYKKGAWALHYLRTQIGERKFKKAVKSYLKEYAFKNVDTDEFLAKIKKVSNFDTDKFKKEWLENADFRWNDAISILNKNTFIVDLQKVKALEVLPFDDKKDQLLTLMTKKSYYPVQQEIMLQTSVVDFEDKKELIDLAFDSNNIKVRQALAQSLIKIPSSYREKFETLLNDESYITKEIALFRLWSNFPDERNRYIDLFQNENGLNYNLKIAHLTLQLVSQQVNLEDKQVAIQELEKLSKAPYESGVRQNALETLINFKLISNSVLTSLIDASMHHKWRFVSYAKAEIRKLISTDEGNQQLKDLLPLLNENQQSRLNSFFNEIK